MEWYDVVRLGWFWMVLYGKVWYGMLDLQEVEQDVGGPAEDEHWGGVGSELPGGSLSKKLGTVCLSLGHFFGPYRVGIMRIDKCCFATRGILCVGFYISHV